MPICVVTFGGAGIRAGAKLTVGYLGCFGCPVLLRLGGCVDGVCQNHDGAVVVVIDISGKNEKDYKGGGLVSPWTTSAAGSGSMALLHHAAIAAAVAESMGGGVSLCL